MTKIDRALDDVSQRGLPRGASVVFERATHGPVVRDTSSRVPVLLAGAVVVVVAVIAAVVLRPTDPPQDVTMELPPTTSVFASRTDTVLLFDDGNEGVVALDLDTGTVVRRTIEGQRPGDQPFRLLRVGTRLVVGWGDIWSATIDDGPSTPLGDGTVFVPAVEHDSVWVVDHPGGRIGQGAPTLRRIGVADGVVLEEYGPQPEGSLPIRGVAGGMAYEVDGGVEVRDRDGVVFRRFDGRIGDVHRDLVAWCGSSPCRSIELLAGSTESQHSIEPRDPAFAVNPDGMRFSPDGSRLAVQTGTEILVVDTADGTIEHAVVDALPDAGWLSWSDDGTQLFYASPGVVGRVDVATGANERSPIDLGQVHSFVAVPRSMLPVLLGEPAPDDVVENLRAGQLDRVSFAEPVRLLLGREAWSGLGALDVHQPQAWSIDAGVFAGYTGPFSSLRTLAAAREITVSDGPVDHCAGSPLPAPTDVEYDTHLVAEPLLDEDSSCLDWFAVEVFLLDGDVVAVALDLWEP